MHFVQIKQHVCLDSFHSLDYVALPLHKVSFLLSYSLRFRGTLYTLLLFRGIILSLWKLRKTPMLGFLETKSKGAKNLKDFCACSNPEFRTIKQINKTPTPGFEPGNPCGNKISSLAEYQIVPRWQDCHD